MEKRELVILFDGPPSHQSGRFVECEDSNGKSVNAGTWNKRDDGLWELRITELPLCIQPLDREKRAQQ